MPAEAPVAERAAPRPLVEVEGLHVRFAETEVLTHVDLTVHADEIVTLVGPNGSGKTTLVRAILGLIEPSAGRVARRADLRIGYVPQRLALDPVLPMTVRRLLRLARPRAEAALIAVLEEVGGAELIERQVDGLSGGEFQRVLLARALLREPQLLVLDEPVRGVDFGGQLALYDLIGRLRRRHGMGVLLVSHDLHIVMAATDRVVCLNHHVCCSGAPEAVSRNPEYIALFGPGAAQRLAVYAHEHDHAHDLRGNVVPAETGADAGPEHPASRRGGAGG